MVMVAQNVQLSARDVMSIATTVSRISAVNATIVRPVVNQAVGATNVTTVVTVLKQYATVETVALIVQQYVLTVTKNVQTALIPISVADAIPVRSAVKETAGAITVAIVVTALKLFVIAETVVVIAPMYAPVAKRNVATAPVICVLIVATAKPA